MGGPPGPAPKSMQASQSLLLSYLQRFNEKRRIHYKVDLQPRQPRETPKKKGLTAVGNSHADAKATYERAVAVLDEETRDERDSLNR